MKKKGIGVGSMWYGIGNTGSANPGAAFVEVLADSTVNLMIGSADIGQGSSTALAQIAAEVLGVKYEDIQVISADTMITPEGGATSASRQTFVSGKAVEIACLQARKVMSKVASELLGEKSDLLLFKNKKVMSKKNADKVLDYKDLLAEMGKRGELAVGAGAYNPQTSPLDPQTMQGVPYEVYSYATAIAQVEVDTETGHITLEKVVSSHDVGKAINPLLAEGQIEGGVVMGEGFALYEKTEHKAGLITNPNYSKYIIPTSVDVPEIFPILVESDSQIGPFGAKGIGEPALIPVIPAILDAVEDAIGIHFYRVPVLPADVLLALKDKNYTECNK